MTHWAGAEHRLNREFGERFGDKAYAFEELVAELSAAFLCAELEITNTPRADHAQYCASWLDVLKGDAKAIFSAASLATTRAVDYLNDLQPKRPSGSRGSRARVVFAGPPAADARHRRRHRPAGGAAMTERARKPSCCAQCRRPSSTSSASASTRVATTPAAPTGAQARMHSSPRHRTGPRRSPCARATWPTPAPRSPRNWRDHRVQRKRSDDTIGGAAPRKTRYEIDWRNPVTAGIVRIRITHSRDYLVQGTDHIEVESINPKRASCRSRRPATSRISFRRSS